jgi:O-antigen/teichoic acid export membrane protein
LRTVSYNFGVATLARVIVNLLGIAVVGIMTRTLGLENFGHYSTVMAYLFIFSILADMGLQAILVREISQNDEDESRITSSIFTLRLLLILASAALSGIVVWFLPYQYTVQLGVVVALLYIVFSSLVQILIGVFQKHLRIYLVSVADIISRCVQLGLLALLVYLNRISLVGFLGVVVAAEIVHFLVAVVNVRKLVKLRLHVDTAYWKKVLKTSFPVAASLVFTLLYFKIDTVFLSLMRDPAEVGIYAVAYKILELVIFIPAIYIGLVFPTLSKYASAKGREFADEFKKAFNILAILAMPAAVYLFVMAGSVVQLIGGDAFAQSGRVLQILTVAIIMIFFGNLGGNALIALDLQKRGMWIYLFGAVFNIVTNLIFIPKHGYIAAGWTTVATEIFVTVAMFIVIARAKTGALSSTVTIKALVSALVMGVIILPFADSLVVATPFAIVYFVFLWLMRGITTQDIRKVLSLRSAN